MDTHTQAVDALAVAQGDDTEQVEAHAHKLIELRGRAFRAVREARKAWLYELFASGEDTGDVPEARDVCALLARCAAELGDDGPVTARRGDSAARNTWLALNAWLAMDAWRRAKGTA